MQDLNELPEYAQKLDVDHPVRVYLDENNYLKKILFELSEADAEKDFQAFFNIFNQVAQVDIRYVRKENQLFPFLEKKGWLGPSHGMWSFHDQIRQQIRDIRAKLEKKDFKELRPDVTMLISEMARMIQIEEMRLFPISLDILDAEDWKQAAQGEQEIGWMHKKIAVAPTPPPPPPISKPVNAAGDSLRMNEGYLSLEQINLLLQVVPLDLTYVDENDKVLFYNRGEERVFPRSAGVIGREVRFCHPPKSVGTVLKILEEFKAGRQNTAEFWINYRGKTIHIRYFAVRDAEKKYRGVIELSQDITDIKNIQGERRLLEWEA
ncbi:MAG: histidine kinase [Bdellovibrio sp. ArHS]|uniref:PAS domain-containing protein n=1 Tax=Bdellovibrio sp. ArHS TaxID=1569284 RepID=UPI0005830038|nr:PAS domain-containing protein [Bdellovibrio sp. ArHS]KHD87514.1 MAG: histidine kinase [Bdellovibrio sp. ArHS]